MAITRRVWIKSLTKALLIILALMSNLTVGISYALGAEKILLVDPDASEITWIGRKLTGQHRGTLKAIGGSLKLVNGIPKSGWIDVDMQSIKNSDIKNEYWRKKLEVHLHSDDFFAVNDFPEARLTLVRCAVLGQSPNQFNCECRLKLRGKELPVAVWVKKETPAIIGSFTFDRTKWGIIYRSQKIANKVLHQIVHDDIQVLASLRFLAKPRNEAVDH